MATGGSAPRVVPPLKQGDRLTREEFEHRYDAMSGLRKAELIEGLVSIPPSGRWRQDACPRADLVGWLGVYQACTAGVQVGAHASIRLDLDNEPQPDAAIIVEPRCGGQVRLSPDDYVIGGPELVGEVAASSVNIDLNAKLRVYRRNEVREYIVWRVLDQAIDWFILRQSQYERLPLSPAGIYQSEVFPGLWLDPAQMTQFNLAAVLQVLQQGIASPEHARFVADLERQAAARSPGG
jgi:hypothetical protein